MLKINPWKITKSKASNFTAIEEVSSTADHQSVLVELLKTKNLITKVALENFLNVDQRNQDFMEVGNKAVVMFLIVVI